MSIQALILYSFQALNQSVFPSLWWNCFLSFYPFQSIWNHNGLLDHWHRGLILQFESGDPLHEFSYLISEWLVCWSRCSGDCYFWNGERWTIHIVVGFMVDLEGICWKKRRIVMQTLVLEWWSVWEWWQCDRLGIVKEDVVIENNDGNDCFVVEVSIDIDNPSKQQNADDKGAANSTQQSHDWRQTECSTNRFLKEQVTSTCKWITFKLGKSLFSSWQCPYTIN